MTTRVRDLYHRVAVHATADREHEAAIELLLLMMVADQHISSDEIEAIRSVSEESGWESDTFSFDQYVGVAMAKVRKANADDALDALLDDIDSRISSTVLRHGLFSACREIAGVDHDIDDAEASLLGQVAARFG